MMHGEENAVSPGSAVPAFLTKIWKLVEDPSCDHLIRWLKDGTSFIIENQILFARELLPLYFKHNNMASFIRQLNMYGFRKVMHVEQGGLKASDETMEFQHNFFLRDHEYLLELIKRKVPVSKPGAVAAAAAATPNIATVESPDVKIRPEIVNRVLADVKQLRGRQGLMDSKLASMKRENEILWREVITLRQKHQKQEQIVNKLIRFFVSLVQPKRMRSMKRGLPLMINNTAHNSSSSASATSSGSNGGGYRIVSAAASSSSAGPVIHDVTDTIDAQSLLDSADVLPPAGPTGVTANDINEALLGIPLVDSPASVTSAVGGATSPVEIPILSIPDLGPSTSSSISEEPVTLDNLPSELLSVDPVTLDFTPDTLYPTDISVVPIMTTPSTSTSIALETPQPQKFTNPFPVTTTVTSQPTTSTVRVSTPQDMLVPVTTGGSDLMLNRQVYKDVIQALDDTASGRSDLADHLDITQCDLDSLHELLSSSTINLDPSTLFGLFSSEDFASKNGVGLNTMPKPLPDSEIIGNEIAQYDNTLLLPSFDEDSFFDPDSVINSPSTDETNEQVNIEEPFLQSILGITNNPQPETTPVLQSILKPEVAAKQVASAKRKKGMAILPPKKKVR